ncbi:hypothetical protein [Ruminococcus sp. Marseille-P6503]|uniref:hypothetical protein n=1 Tax=Ruminococcus sp. Marseille-P6503 TaxID=2364796 RepID=UPI000F52FD32|nr:hypothetical protein [Ruminococcus sp. Marseille-P6503]
MALFGHKKRTEETKGAPKAQINPDDIWNTPVRKKPDGSETVVIKESKYDEPSAETVGPAAIDPETIRKKMEQLETELEAQKNKPVKTYIDYDVDPVFIDEVLSAQEAYEKRYEIEHKRYIETHVQDIASADADDIDRKVNQMLDETAKRAQAVRDKNYGIEQVDGEEVSRGLSQLKDPKDVTKDKNFKNIEAVPDELMSGVEDYIRNELDTRVCAEADDGIEEITAEQAAAKTQEFLEKYKDRKINK